MYKQIGVLTGGGDAPGLNAVIRAVVRTAIGTFGMKCIGMEDGFVRVVSPIDDSPASRAGLKAGDLIVKLDDTSVKGMTLNDAVKRMRGKPNTQIVLTIVRKGETKPLVVTLTRAVIKIQSVKATTLEPGYAYFRVTQFQEGTGELLARAIETHVKGPMKGIILDLRNDPGGLLNSAVAVSAFDHARHLHVADGLVVALWGPPVPRDAAHCSDASLFDTGLEARGYPLLASGGYTKDPVFAEIIREALRLGFRLVPYDPFHAEHDQAQREQTQADNLACVFKANPKARLLVIGGFSHIDEGESKRVPDRGMMARRFRKATGIDPLTVAAAKHTHLDPQAVRGTLAPHDAVGRDSSPEVRE